jgi:hypothetical protein
MRRTALGISTGLVLFAAATWPQGPPLEVHVVNASGEPVEHAMVRLRSLSSEVQPLSRPTPRQAGESRPEFWAPTDARGIASFGPLNPVSVEVRVSEDASLWVNGEPEAVNRVDFTGAPGPLVITVNTAEIESVEVTGQVVNSATGQPVSGASVWWGSWAEGGAWATAPRVHADEIGRFHLRVGAYPFEMRIFASAPGFLEAEHRASGNREREEIVALTPAVTLHGFVTRDGDPAPEAELLLLQEMEGAFQISGSRGCGRRRTRSSSRSRARMKWPRPA